MGVQRDRKENFLVTLEFLIIMMLPKRMIAVAKDFGVLSVMYPKFSILFYIREQIVSRSISNITV